MGAIGNIKIMVPVPCATDARLGATGATTGGFDNTGLEATSEGGRGGGRRGARGEATETFTTETAFGTCK